MAGAELTVVAEAAVVGWSSVPSLGVTKTLTVSPLLPLLATARSKVSDRSALVPADLVTVRLTVPFTFQTYVRLTGLLSGSLLLAVAVRVSLVFGEPVLRLTV